MKTLADLKCLRLLLLVEAGLLLIGRWRMATPTTSSAET
jgi:hypothetical protein